MGAWVKDASMGRMRHVRHISHMDVLRGVVRKVAWGTWGTRVHETHYAEELAGLGLCGHGIVALAFAGSERNAENLHARVERKVRVRHIRLWV